MAASLLIHPDNWDGMGYMNVLLMLFEASAERCKVCALVTHKYYSTLPSGNLEHTFIMKAISMNLKAALTINDPTRRASGYLNDNIDISNIAIPLDITDITWDMTAMLADIGDPTFLDYSVDTLKATPPPPLVGDFGYKSTEHLIQWYNIITRLKTPFATLAYIGVEDVYGSDDAGIHSIGVENPNVDTIGRAATMDLEGINGYYSNTTGGHDYDNWDAAWGGQGKIDHDADYPLLYPFPPNDGTTAPDSDTYFMRREDTKPFNLKPVYDHKMYFTSRNQYQSEPNPPFASKKYRQEAIYQRIKASIDYSGISMNGFPNEVRWIARTVNSVGGVGVVGNPYPTDELFFVDHPISAGVTTDTYFGDYPGRPASINNLDVATQYTPWVGFETFMDTLTMFESWDYEGGFDYRTPPAP